MAGFILLETISLLVITSTGSQTLEAGDIFKEQPNSTEVTEPDVATFGCSIENQMFSIFWFVNGSDAGYARFQQRGVNIETISYTESILHIVGYKENNNTLVHCAILMEYPQLMWVNSRIASLRVVHSVLPSSSVSQALQFTTSSTTVTYTEISPKATPGLKHEEDTVPISLKVIVACSLVLIAVVILTITSLMIVWKKVVCGELMDQVQLEDTIEVKVNPTYEWKDLPKCRRNIAYEAVQKEK